VHLDLSRERTHFTNANNVSRFIALLFNQEHNLKMTISISFYMSIVSLLLTHAVAFAPSHISSVSTNSSINRLATKTSTKRQQQLPSTTSLYATISEKEAQNAINKVVTALKKDKSAKEELGNLEKVNNILGYGSPKPGTIAVRFNASFKRGGMGRSAVPLPFGLGQSEKQEGRGTMVGQVKASVDAKSGKVLEASVFRDLGYGRAFNLKV
jgi:hypothetical protein